MSKKLESLVNVLSGKFRYGLQKINIMFSVVGAHFGLQVKLMRISFEIITK